MPNLSSLTTNFFPTPNEGFITTTSGPVDSSTDTTIGFNSVSGLTDGSIFTGLIDPGNAKERAFTGVVDTGGSQITGVKFTTGSNATHTAGATIVDYVTGTHIGQISKGIQQEHNNDGTHSDVTATSVDTDTLVVNTGTTLPAGDIGTNDLADASVTSAKIDFGGSGAGVWWEEIGRTTLGSAGDTITVSFTAKKYLIILLSGLAAGGTLDTTYIFNSDSASNYAYTASGSMAAGATATSVNALPLELGATDSGGVLAGKIEVLVNLSGEEKLLVAKSLSTDAAGAGTVAATYELMGKWANTSAQLSSITWNNTGSGNFDVGSEVIVLGHN